MDPSNGAPMRAGGLVPLRMAGDICKWCLHSRRARRAWSELMMSLRSVIYALGRINNWL